MDTDFPFLGSGRPFAKRRSQLLLVAQAPLAAPTLAKAFPKATVRLERQAAVLTWPTAPPKLEVKLRQLHKTTPLLLAVRPGRVEPDDWHRASLGDPRVLLALEAVVRAAPSYVNRPPLPLQQSQLDVLQLLAEGVSGRAPGPEVLRAALERLISGTQGGARAVLFDQLLEALPPLMGRDFECDAVLRVTLARIQRVSPAAVPVGEAFAQALANRFLRPSTEAGPSEGDDPGWESVAHVRAALAAGRLAKLGILDENAPRAVRTLLQLEPHELLALAKSSGANATRLANAATVLMMGGKYEEALRLYDGALEGDFDAGAAANPLYAVQDDNSHLGVVPERHRRYLARCLPHGDRNPAVYLNAAFVWMELGEPAQALDALEQCQARGKPVRGSKNERLFAPLRRDPRFKKLMG